MYIAKCRLDNKIYLAKDFNQSDEIIGEKKNYLICPTCGQSAHYRRSSRDGKRACFFADHSENCKFKNDSPARSDNDRPQIRVGRFENDPDEIELILGDTSSRSSSRRGAQVIENEATFSRVSKKHIGEPASKKVSKFGPKTLLDCLLVREDFALSDKPFRFNGEVWKTKDFFVNFNNTEKGHEGKIHGFWGSIDKASDDLGWLYPPFKKESLSICVGDIKNALSEKYGIKGPGDFSGANVLIVGELKRSQKGNRIIVVKKLSEISLKLVK